MKTRSFDLRISCGGTALYRIHCVCKRGQPGQERATGTSIHLYYNGEVLQLLPLERNLLELGAGTGNWNLSYWNRGNNSYLSLELALCSFSG
jgi:hypothetical protein